MGLNARAPFLGVVMCLEISFDHIFVASSKSYILYKAMTTMSSTEYSQLLRFLGVVGNNENLEMYTSSDNSGSSGKRRRNSIKTLYIASNRADDHRRKSITIISIVTSSTSTVKKREREREREEMQEKQ